jgi:asparagine synthase (glutamine-hydrolysing)
VLKSALGPYLPAAILRRPKMGFAAPLAAWLRGSLLAPVERALAEPAFADAGLFDPAAVRRLIEQHRSGRSDHGRLIWALFMFARFLTGVHEPEAARLADGMAGSSGSGAQAQTPAPVPAP